MPNQEQYVASLEEEVSALREEQKSSVIQRLEAFGKLEGSQAKLKKALNDEVAKNKKLLSEIKELKMLNPERLKKNLAEQKNKTRGLQKTVAEQKKETKATRATVGIYKERAEKMEMALNVCLDERDGFYFSDDNRWQLRLTGFRFPGEPESNRVLRIRCLDGETGTSVLADHKDDKGLAIWSGDIGIPEDISIRAAQEMDSLKETGQLMEV